MIQPARIICKEILIAVAIVYLMIFIEGLVAEPDISIIANSVFTLLFLGIAPFFAFGETFFAPLGCVFFGVVFYISLTFKSSIIRIFVLTCIIGGWVLLGVYCSPAA